MRIFIRTAAAIVLMLPCSHAPLAQTQVNREACDKYRKADAEMNRVYLQIQKGYEADVLFIEKLKKAQKAWLVFRDAHLESLYPAPNKLAEYGSVNEMCRCGVLEELTNQRTNALKKWVTGLPEGDVCSGSIRFRK